MEIISGLKSKVDSVKDKIRSLRDNYYSKDKKERNRIAILALSSLMFLNYVMFSYHIESNIFDIFPSIPVIEDRVTINIYIPSEGASEIISEERVIHDGLPDEVLVKKLFSLIAAGSFYENTALNVPAKYTIKKIWITEVESGHGKICAIDLMPEMLDSDISVVKGSEKLFKESLEKTIIENMPGITGVVILENGVPFRPLWEI